MTADPVPLSDAIAEYLAAAVAALTLEQRDRLAVLLWPAPHAPGPRAPRSVASAGSASLRKSPGSSAYPTRTAPQDGTQAQDGRLTRAAPGATPGATS